MFVRHGDIFSHSLDDELKLTHPTKNPNNIAKKALVLTPVSTGSVGISCLTRVPAFVKRETASVSTHLISDPQLVAAKINSLVYQAESLVTGFVPQDAPFFPHNHPTRANFHSPHQTAGLQNTQCSAVSPSQPIFINIRPAGAACAPCSHPLCASSRLPHAQPLAQYTHHTQPRLCYNMYHVNQTILCAPDHGHHCLT